MIAMYTPGVWTQGSAQPLGPQHRRDVGGQDEALRIWAVRNDLDPEAVVAWEWERFQGGRRKSRPGIVWADPEACARGTYRMTRERLEEQKRQERGW
jgi:hypothetical protein